MSDENKPTSGAPEEEWVPIGGGPARKAGPAGPLAGEPEAPQEEKVYGVRTPTPPGRISLRIGAIALALALLLYIFADLRDVDMLGQRPVRIGYALMLIPALGILWGLIGLVKRQPGDLRPSMVGIVLSLASIGIAFGTAATIRAAAPTGQPVMDRSDLAPKDLNQWREEKLRRSPETN